MERARSQCRTTLVVKKKGATEIHGKSMKMQSTGNQRKSAAHQRKSKEIHRKSTENHRKLKIHEMDKHAWEILKSNEHL